MSIINPCLIAMGLSTASIVTSMVIYGNKRSQLLYETLTSDQQIIYNKIKFERTQLYIKAYLFSAILSIFYSYVISQRMSIDYCIFSLMTHTMTLLIYKFYPKDNHLEDHLTTDKQKLLYEKLIDEITYAYILGIFGGVGLHMINNNHC